MKTGALIAVIAVSGANAQLSITWQASSDKFYLVQSNTCLNRFWQDVTNVQNVDGDQAVAVDTIGDCGLYRVLGSDSPFFTWGFQKLSQAEFFTAWDLGSNEVQHVDLDKAYDWYRDQLNTGYAWVNNCGPTSTEMAARWYDPNTKLTAEAARDLYPEGGGWWFMSDINATLNAYQIPNRFIQLPSASTLTNLLANGSIAILCIDTGYIPIAQGGEWRSHAMYSTGLGSGHMLVAKGYRITDTESWIECYDPDSEGYTFQDGVLAGRDRHYSFDEITAASGHWWPYALVIDPPGTVQAQAAQAYQWVPDQHAP